MKWKCPKCGREFARQDQPHYCGKPQTVDEYILAQDEQVRPKLNEVRAILRDAIPDAGECISWSMPTYRKGRNLIHFAASKKHIGLYPGGEATSVFAEELTGFDVEVGKEIAAYLGVEARFEEAAWEALLAGVKAGRFDIVCNGVGYTEERAESLEFSDPYVYTRKVLIVSDSNEEIQSFEDLNGKNTANSPGSTYAAIAEEYGAKVEYIDTFGETITMLTQGRIDATINSEVSYLDYMAQHPDAPIKIVAESEGEAVCYPVMKGETELCAAVNEALQSLRDSGRLAELSNKYFGGDITNK